MNRRHIRVLLVEDNPDHAELIRRSLEPQADLMSLTVARNLAEARSSLAESPADVALIDLKLPDGSGIELLPPAGEPAPYPIVILTAEGGQEVAVEAMRAGALNYVVKTPESFADMPRIVEATLREWGHIVERRRAEEKLQASEAHYRSLIENAHDVIITVDEEGQLDYTSPAISRVLGYTPTERVGTNYFELIHPEDRAEVIRKVHEAFFEPGVVQLLEYRVLHKDGSVRILESVGSSPPQTSDRPPRAVLNSRDVTDRKQLEDQLRHSQKWEVIGALAGGIANEFNNMLTPILGFAGLALEESASGSKEHKRLQHILTAANRAQELAERLLAFSRQSEPRRVPVEMCSSIEEALKFLRPTLPRTIEIRSRIHVEHDVVMADPDQIHQVLVNLCTDAHYSMPDGGILEVALDEVGSAAELAERSRLHDDDYLRLTVRDTGRGMDPKTKERALKPFFNTTQSEQMTGLSLAVTYGIVVSHGGDLAVDSEPGKGTAVHVYLPLADRDL